jgi:hypothetical protein
MSTNTGGPAFPFSLHIGGNAGIVDAEECGAGGMTLRDYFAAKAMQGFAADDSDGWRTLDHMAQSAYRWADAMLKAREA